MAEAFQRVNDSKFTMNLHTILNGRDPEFDDGHAVPPHFSPS
jgi:hypothetical protein